MPYSSSTRKITKDGGNMNHIDDKKWQLDKRLAFRTISDETIIIGISGGEVHLLNETASFLWNMLSKGAESAPSLTAALIANYDIDAATAQEDVSEFLTNLAAKKLITKSPAA